MSNTDQIEYWNTRAAESWVALQEHLDSVFAPLTEVALGAAAPAAGEHVIDVGCGCGATTLRLGALVGRSGHVLGLDVSQPMAARARERVAAAGLGNVEIRVEDASTAALPPADLLFSRFGVMFFDDPAAAFGHLRGAMRPGGRMLCAVWRPVAENPWFKVPMDAVRGLFPALPPQDPNAPGPFAFADAERVRGIMAAAGWRDVKLTPRDVGMPVAGAGETDRAAAFSLRIGPVARMLAEADPALRPQVEAAIASALRPFDGPSGVVLPGAFWLISGVA